MLGIQAKHSQRENYENKQSETARKGRRVVTVTMPDWATEPRLESSSHDDQKSEVGLVCQFLSRLCVLYLPKV